MSEWGKAVREVALSAAVCVIFYLIATALAAVFVRAYAPADGAVLAVNWVINAAGAVLLPLLSAPRGRAFSKASAAGIRAPVLAMLLFAAIGGGFRINAFFLVELLVCGALGGLGALVGTALRRE